MYERDSLMPKGVLHVTWMERKGLYRATGVPSTVSDLAKLIFLSPDPEVPEKKPRRRYGYTALGSCLRKVLDNNQGRRSMKKIDVSAYELAQRFVGIKEVPGSTANPQILAMLKLDLNWPEDDSVPWCSGFVNYIAWLLRLPRSKSLRARSWLTIGEVIALEEAEAGFDLVVFKRGGANQPGPEIIDAPGHVGFYAGIEGKKVLTLGGNQGDSVSISSYPKSRLLGVRRLV